MNDLSSNIYASSWNVNFKIKDLISDKDKEEILMSLLDKEDDLMPILKKYLVGYLEKIMDNPKELVKELIDDKDDKIQNLEQEIKNLRLEIDYLRNALLTTQVPPPYTPYTGNPSTNPWMIGNWDIKCDYSNTTDNSF